jgi:hypothetical protein
MTNGSGRARLWDTVGSHSSNSPVEGLNLTLTLQR